MRRLFAASLILSLCAAAHADTVKMKDGEVISGRVVSSNEEQLEVVTSSGTRTLYKNQIDGVTYEPAPEAARLKTEKAPYFPTVSFRPVRFFGAIEAYTASDGDDRFKTNFESAVDDASVSLGPTTFDLSTQGGAGVRVGVLFCRPSGWEAGPSVGFVRGPSAEGTLSSETAPGSFLIQDAEIETRFVRVLIELRRTKRLSKRTSVRIGGAIGAARGVIEEIDTDSGNSSGSFSADESWNGATWEVSPALVFDVNPVSIEFGVRYSHFPTKSGSLEFDKFEWNPFSVFAGLVF